MTDEEIIALSARVKSLNSWQLMGVLIGVMKDKGFRVTMWGNSYGSCAQFNKSPEVYLSEKCDSLPAAVALAAEKSVKEQAGK